MTTIDGTDYMTIAEVQEVLGATRATVIKWYSSTPWEPAKLDARKVAGSVLVTRESVERLKREKEAVE